ncbi:MAG: SDR family oxidoreductase [Candidatus Omnitrophica bacterium]|nr:SDR family oxidoreductase [Candidatus Omnitrophota bacterium]
MRILILGGSGMLGHAAWQSFRNDFDTYVTLRGAFAENARFKLFDRKKTICGARAEDFPAFEKSINTVKPDVILNCIGIVKQTKEASDPTKSIEVNSLFPHKLAVLCRRNDCRLIHLSTDCVFSGKKGRYTENDNPDPVDLYSRTKLLGEVTDANALTIRTSMIGRELNTRHGLLEWFLSQKGKTVKGYTKVIFSGFTTTVLCTILKEIIFNHADLKGLYHISSEPISKYKLLSLINAKLGLKIKIIPYDEVKIDRSLDSSRFRRETAYHPPLWEAMAAELANTLKGRK